MCPECARYGATEAALRAAIIHADETDTIWGPKSEPVLQAALALTPSAAAEAVQKMAEAAEGTRDMLRQAVGLLGHEHAVFNVQAETAIECADEALSPFLPPGAGRRGALKLSRQQRDFLDWLADRLEAYTRPGRGPHRTALSLKDRGLVEYGPTGYCFETNQQAWRITQAGRDALAARGGEGHA